MRSSKNRSRGKSNNRNRNPGNNLNRVFDSSGPEGKVRGTPQQIIDKYTQLVRDSTLANDRVAAENFQQHAEHYTRLLGEAQRAAETKRLQSEQLNRERQVREREEREARIARQEAASAASAIDQPQAQSNDLGEMPQPDAKPQVKPQAAQPSEPAESQPKADTNADSGLVETPESKPKRRAPRPRKPRPPKVIKEASHDGEQPAIVDAPDSEPKAPKAAE